MFNIVHYFVFQKNGSFIEEKRDSSTSLGMMRPSTLLRINFWGLPNFNLFFNLSLEKWRYGFYFARVCLFCKILKSLILIHFLNPIFKV